jgi:ABC-2 type transport system permease protein
MIALVRAEVRKLLTTRLILGLLLAAAALALVGVLAQLALQDHPELRSQGAVAPIRTQAELRLVMSAGSTVALFTLVLGATSVTGEYRYGTIATTFLAEPHRWRVVAGKVAASTLVGAGFGLAVQAAVTLAAMAWLATSGGPVPIGTGLLPALLATPLASSLAAALGVGVGAAMRSQLAAIVASLGWALVVETLVTGLVPRVRPWLPYAGGVGAVAGGPGASDLHAPWVGGVMVIGYVAAFAVVAAWLVERRDV